jgi:hypothetical protein
LLHKQSKKSKTKQASKQAKAGTLWNAQKSVVFKNRDTPSLQATFQHRHNRDNTNVA